MVALDKKIQEQYPFLSLVKYGEKEEYVGIIQNYDDTVMSIYNVDRLRSDEAKATFLLLGEQWWWESNRQIPINLFIKEDWAEFRDTLVNLNSKDCEIVFGPSVSIQELSRKRSKRRNIQLVKKVK